MWAADQRRWLRGATESRVCVEERADKFYADFAQDLSVEPDITQRGLLVFNCGKQHNVLLKQGTLHATHVDVKVLMALRTSQRALVRSFADVGYESANAGPKRTVAGEWR